MKITVSIRTPSGAAARPLGDALPLDALRRRITAADRRASSDTSRPRRSPPTAPRPTPES
jgi:hypothetical protein